MSSLTERMLGISTGPGRAPNTYPLWRYVLLLLIISVGVIYALPNLFPPDYALQVRPDEADQRLTPDVLERATQALTDAGIEVKGRTLEDGNALIRVTSSQAQLRGRDVVAAALDTGEQRDFVVALNLAPTTPDWLQSLGARPMPLGLDLSGGVHFLLEVDIEKALADRMENDADIIRDKLREQRLRYVPGRDWVSGTRLNIAFYEEAVRDQASTLIGNEHNEYLVVPRDVASYPGLWLTLREEVVDQFVDDKISQNLISLRNRVNELGVSEPLVQRLGHDRIVVDLPGVQDSADAKRILNRFANLEFRRVAPDDAQPRETETYMYEGREVEILRRNIVTGDRVVNATQDFDPESNLPQVSITLDSTGGDLMHRGTRDHIGEGMAVLYIELKPRMTTEMVDGEEVVTRRSVEEKRLINVATIRDALGHRFRITGLGLGEARDLALLLRAGALAAPMYIVEERTVGASLGEENIERGMNSMIIGFVLVLLFMLAYYKVFGIAANIALTVNIILLAALMSILGATLTLPGIAGMVLTVGMAVDANVLIFSRIREELASRSPQAAIQAGFDRAFLTIIDANVTTLFVAVILLAIGTGPVKGFAVVLSLGILTSVFTAVMITRALVNLMYGGRSVKRLLI